MFSIKRVLDSGASVEHVDELEKYGTNYYSEAVKWTGCTAYAIADWYGDKKRFRHTSRDLDEALRVLVYKDMNGYLA